MKKIILTKIHNGIEEPIHVPINIEYEGSNTDNTTIWWIDDESVKQSATVKESIKQIQEKITNCGNL